MITILNTSILTGYGSYEYLPVDISQVRLLLDRNEWQSAVGHQSTAELLSALLERPIPVNRIQFVQSLGDLAIVFKLKSRAPEGVILTREQIETIGYEFGTLERVDNKAG